MKETKNIRGFSRIEFNDLYDNKCSIQESSLATESAIWLGICDANPQVMVSDLGLPANGWAKYPIPECVHMTTRMHLNRAQVVELIAVLQTFVENDEVKLDNSV